MGSDEPMTPLVTIVIPSLNQGVYIEWAIQSALSQDYPEIELIVIDGGSTDGTLEILRRYSDRLTWITEPDSGQSQAINKGFRRAKGEILAWLNADDMYLPGAVSRAVRFLNTHPEIMMVHGRGYVIDEEGSVILDFPREQPDVNLWRLIYEGDYVLQQSSFFRKSIFDSIDLLDESLHYAMDWDLFIRIGQKFRVGYIYEHLASIRQYPETKSSSGGVRRFRELTRIIRKYGTKRYPQSYVNALAELYFGWFGRPADHQLKSRPGYRPPGRVLKAVRFFLRIYYHIVRQGFSPEGWLERQSSFILPNFYPEAKKHTLRMVGEVSPENIPLEIHLTVGKDLKNCRTITEPGAFIHSVPIVDGMDGQSQFALTIKCTVKKAGRKSRRPITPVKLLQLDVIPESAERLTSENHA